MKKILGVLTVALMILILTPDSVSATGVSDDAEMILEGSTVVDTGIWDNVSWSLDSAGKLTVSGNGEMPNLSVMGDAWSSHRDEIKAIEIMDGVSSIGNSTFSDMKNLESVVIPNSVTKIGIVAFSGDEKLVTVKLPDNLNSIELGAFADCTGLTEINIPANLTKIGEGVFAGCSNLAIIRLEGDCGGYPRQLWLLLCPDEEENAVWIKDVYYPGTIRQFRDNQSLGYVNNVHCSDGDILWNGEYYYRILSDDTVEIVAYCGNKSIVTVPEKIGGKTVSGIGYHAFGGITEVRIPGCIKYIGDYAFYSCRSLEKVTFSEGLESIGKVAFCWDDKITSVTLPHSLKSVGEGAFAENWYILEVTYSGTIEELKSVQWGECIFHQDVTFHCIDGDIRKSELSKTADENDIPEGPDTWKGKTGVDGFVSRLYNVAMAREAEQAGFDDWNQRLESKSETAAEVAQGFIFSEEFLNKNYNDVQFIKILYRTMFGREADESGMKDWLSALENGMSREYVYHGFAESPEFTNLCESYNVERGEVHLSAYRDQNRGATGFIARLYTKMLGRGFDVAGIEDWCGKYLRGEYTIENIATDGFLHSQEFINQNLSDEEFVTRMYETFLDREPDMAGLEDWVGRLQNGEITRDKLVYGFTNSQEFGNIKASYGLK